MLSIAETEYSGRPIILDLAMRFLIPRPNIIAKLLHRVSQPLDAKDEPVVDHGRFLLLPLGDLDLPFLRPPRFAAE
jgi:hypothetical protein